ncbi:hypothetical protein [Achromobacter spanius]|uniref:Phasin family protein n=1 Tax=Achromobacter spanius TaxID=217203 RepID=A0AAW3I4U0_9BURK|nr:hypothetical protein [Achromobacter spanius]AZS80855.1 hypothetical protein ELS24_21855 [Achromobacter spanius]KNE26852.1 hypothetical protein AFM18_15525 [Achromobacter spanius]MCW3151706.1 hypothetical protein [Achromobacter spanius]
MQPVYEPYTALYKYGLDVALSAASNYFEYVKELRTLQLKVDKEMVTWMQQAHTEIDAEPSIAGICALQQKHMTDLIDRELKYFKELERIFREASASTSQALRNSRNPWQDRFSQIAEDVAQVVAHGSAAEKIKA